MVKHTIAFPYIGVSVSDSILYINFEFCEGKIEHINLQSQEIYVYKIISARKA